MELVLGNIFIRPFYLSTDRTKTGFPANLTCHAHNFDHVTYVRRGRVRVRCYRAMVNADGTPTLGNDGSPARFLHREREVGVGERLLIEAADWHEFEALELYCALDCIFAHRDPQSHEVVQGYNGWDDANQLQRGPHAAA
jgi:hypothetical protein